MEMKAAVGKGVYMMDAEFGDKYRVIETGEEGEVIGVVFFQDGNNMVCLAPFTEDLEKSVMASWYYLATVEKVN